MSFKSSIGLFCAWGPVQFHRLHIHDASLCVYEYTHEKELFLRSHQSWLEIFRALLLRIPISMLEKGHKCIKIYNHSWEHACAFPFHLFSEVHLLKFKGPHETCTQGSSGQQQLLSDWAPELCPRPPFPDFPVSQRSPAVAHFFPIMCLESQSSPA